MGIEATGAAPPGLANKRFGAMTDVTWEQGRRSPSGAARTLLLVVAKNPRALLDVA